ncbi:MAG TPA: sulfite exporter TauE/SafE family protein, partial [Rhizomicrobium sp.]|nr:sulfite exporter TauE/SafE family protein [Rhizomicrobium sp.]
MGPEDIATLLVGAFAGAACSFLNTVASSGSAVSLPILMAVGLSPLMANATNRVPVLIGAMAAAVQFWRKGHIEIPLALKVCLPVTLGAVLGTLYAEALPSRDMGLIITASVMTALLLLFTKVKSALETIQALPTQFGIREFVLLFAIGAWLGFIVLDGATYLLMALVLSAHVPLVQANALKNVALVP